MEAAPSSPKLRRDAQRNRDKIVEAARRLFSQRGLGVSLDDIAREAGVGVATAYRHFPAKDPLIDAVVADLLTRFVALGEEALAMERAWDGLVHWLTTATEMQAVNAGLSAVMKSHLRGGESTQRAHEQIGEQVGELVRRAHAQGDLRRDFELSDIPALNHMLGAAVDLSEQVAPGTWRRHLGLLLDGMRRSRERPSKLGAPPLTIEQMEQALEK